MDNNGYYIKIKGKDNKYYFQLWYRGKQEMGNSCEYNTYGECENGLYEFKEFIINNHINAESNLLKVIKLDVRKYIYQFFNEK